MHYHIKNRLTMCTDYSIQMCIVFTLSYLDLSYLFYLAYTILLISTFLFCTSLLSPSLSPSLSFSCSLPHLCAVYGSLSTSSPLTAHQHKRTNKQTDRRKKKKGCRYSTNKQLVSKINDINASLAKTKREKKIL